MRSTHIKSMLFSLAALLIIDKDVYAQDNDTVRLEKISAKPNSNGPLPFDKKINTGYYTAPLKKLSGSIASIPGTSIQNQATPGFQSALQGKLPGVHIIRANGMPGSDVIVRIRGTASIYAGSDPLYVIDGMPVYSGPRQLPNRGLGNGFGSVFNPLSDFNQQDIESIEVLKDGAAASIYGSRAGSGVILVTTKRGQKNNISFNHYEGVSSETNRVGTLNGPEYLQVLDESWVNSGRTGQGPLPAGAALTRARATTTNTNHMDQVLRSGRTRQSWLSAGYAGKSTSFYFSGSYGTDKGIITGNELTRATARVKAINQLTKKLQVGVNVGLHFITHKNMPVGYSPGGGFSAGMLNLPVYPLFRDNQLTSDGLYFYTRDPSILNIPGSNVLSFQDKQEFESKERTNRVYVAANFEYNILSGLSLRTELSMDRYYHTTQDYFSKRLRLGSLGSGVGRQGEPTAYASYEKYSTNSYNNSTTLTYKKASGKHDFTGLAGFDIFYSQSPFYFMQGEGFTNDFFREPYVAAYKNNRDVASTITNVYSFLGFYGNVNYVYNEKFMIGATYRVDGSTRFGANNKYAPYPAASIGWVISKEDFISSTEWISFLKLRAGFGQTGNAQIGNYSSLERWELNETSRYLSRSGVQAASLGSPELKPERITQLNLGLDFSVLKNRIAGSIDVYRKTTNDLILRYQTALSAGVNEPGLLLNSGSLRNSGIELGVSSQNLTGALTWSTGLSIARNKNEVLDLDELSPLLVSPNRNIATFVGQPLGTFYLVEYAGVDPTTGMEMIYDQGGNKIVATDPAQILAARVAQKDKPSAPRFFGGLNNSFTYKNFELSALVTFSYGNYVLDEGERVLSYVSGNNNLLSSVLNDGAPRQVYNNPIAGYNTTRFLHDASYLRMKEITLGYSLKSMLQKVKFLQQAKVYVTAQNLFTVTSFPGWDPEVAGNYLDDFNRNLSQGINYMDVPQVRTFAAGLSITF